MRDRETGSGKDRWEAMRLALKPDGSEGVCFWGRRLQAERTASAKTPQCTLPFLEKLGGQ